MQLGLRAAAFLLLFFALQLLWETQRGSAVERWWVHDAMAASAATMINAVTPGVAAKAEGARIAAQGGGLNILAGCEGTDVLFLLVAALTVAPLRARARCAALLAGVAVAWLLNQARIVALFFAFRHDATLFEFLHTVAAPLTIVALAAWFFQACLAYSSRDSSSPPPP